MTRSLLTTDTSKSLGQKHSQSQIAADKKLIPILANLRENRVDVLDQTPCLLMGRRIFCFFHSRGSLTIGAQQRLYKPDSKPGMLNIKLLQTRSPLGGNDQWHPSQPADFAQYRNTHPGRYNSSLQSGNEKLGSREFI